MTDVKHVYAGGELDLVNLGPTGTFTDLSGYLGGPVGVGDGFAVITRDPVAPLYLTSSTQSLSSGAQTTMWSFGQDWRALDNVEPHASIYLLPGMLVEQTLTNTEDHLLEPIAYANTKLLGASDPWESMPDHPLVGCSRGHSYGWYGGGYFRVVLKPYFGTQAPSMGNFDITVRIQLERFLSASGVDDHEVQGPWSMTLTQTAVATTGIVVNVIPTNCQVGWYRFRVVDTTYSTTVSTWSPTVGVSIQQVILGSSSFTGSQLLYPFTGAGSTSTWLRPEEKDTTTPATVGMLTHMRQVVPSTVPNTRAAGSPNLAPFMYKACRVNAMSFLLKNTSASLTAGGDVYGARFPAGMPISSITPNLVIESSMNHRMYRGNLKDGAYTWMESPGVQNDFLSGLYDAVWRNGTTESRAERAFHDLDRPNAMHIIMWKTALGKSNGTGSGLETWQPQLQFRLDMHLEFISASPIARNAITPLTAAELEQCVKALAGAPLVTENWAHLDQIWSALKSGAASAARAGLGAAARVAMSELVAMLATVAL